MSQRRAKAFRMANCCELIPCEWCWDYREGGTDPFRVADEGADGQALWIADSMFDCRVTLSGAHWKVDFLGCIKRNLGDRLGTTRYAR
jgi:hypothetical protein